MNQAYWTAVDKYITDLLVPPEATLDAALAASSSADLPPIQVSPNLGKLLHLMARAIGARRILELGTLGGYSTLWLARALPANGRLISLEAKAKNAQIARDNIAQAGFSDLVEVRVGQALDTLPQLATEDAHPFDLIFVDADKSSYPDYFTWAIELSHSGSMIIADNVVRAGAVIDAENSDPNVQGVRKFNEMMAADPRVSATAIQIVGSKGHDGFAIALVN